MSGPSEMDRNAAADMGLSTADLADLVQSFNWIQAKAYAEILKRGKFSWNQVRRDRLIQPSENMCLAIFRNQCPDLIIC